MEKYTHKEAEEMAKKEYPTLVSDTRSTISHLTFRRYDFVKGRMSLADKCMEMQEENDRLKRNLEEIASKDSSYCRYIEDWSGLVVEIQQYAYEALNHKDNDKAVQ